MFVTQSLLNSLHGLYHPSLKNDLCKVPPTFQTHVCVCTHVHTCIHTHIHTAVKDKVWIPSHPKPGASSGECRWAEANRCRPTSSHCSSLYCTSQMLNFLKNWRLNSLPAKGLQLTFFVILAFALQWCLLYCSTLDPNLHFLQGMSVLRRRDGAQLHTLD